MVVGKPYVKSILSPSIKKINSFKKPLDIDPSKSGFEDTKQKIGELVREIIKSITKSADHFPLELKSLLQYMSSELVRKHGTTNNVVLQQFLFSRLIIPAILDPLSWSLSKEPLNSDCTRTSISVSKILNSVATGSSFEEKSPLSAFNLTIKKYQSRLADFVESLISSFVDTSSIKVENMITEETSDAAFQCIHFCLYLWKVPMANYRNNIQKVTAHEAKIFFDLFGVLEEIELAEGKPEIGDKTLLGYDKNTTFFKMLSRANIRPKPPTPNAPKEKQDKSSRPPFVRQQSEHLNREHQKFLIEQRKRENEQKELQARKTRNAYIRKQSESNLKSLVEKKDTATDNKDVIPESSLEDDDPDIESSFTKEEVTEKSETSSVTPTKKKKRRDKDKDVQIDIVVTPISKHVSKSNDELTPRLTPRAQTDNRDRSSSFTVKSKSERYVDFDATIKDLGAENSRLAKEKEIFLKEIELLRKEFSEYKDDSEKKMSKLYNYNSNLIKSIMYRRQKNDEIRRLVLKLKRTHHPSLDDDMFDFAGTSLEDRRRIIYEALNYNPSEKVRSHGKRDSDDLRDKYDRMDSLERFTQKIIEDVDSSQSPEKNDDVQKTIEKKPTKSPTKKLKKQQSRRKASSQVKKMPELD